MRRSRLAVLALATAIAAGCGASDSRPPTRDVAAGHPAGSAATATATAAPQISDDECRARGGQIVTEQTYAHLRRARRPDEPVTPFRICRIPSPKNGAACRGDADCAGGRCFCAGALARPDPGDDPALRALDGTAASGRCSDQPLPDGSWFCLVEDGTVHLDGIIID